jgi:serine/threonine protein kinase
MGQVYLGRDGAGRWAAVKVIHDTHLTVPEFRHRFAREIRIASRVRAPWTVTVLAADPDAPRPWLATEYVVGPSLQQAIDSAGPLPEELVGIMASRLADALVGLHSLGLVHRDLKPSNIMLAEDGPRLLDFGIATVIDATRITATGLTVGTPAFMSPEQTRGEDGGPPSDIFSLASALTFAATGTGPFKQASNPVAMLMRVNRDTPDLTAIPRQLREELQPCLAKDPAQRPTGHQLAHTLAHWVESPRGHRWPPPVIARLATPLPTVVAPSTAEAEIPRATASTTSVPLPRPTAPALSTPGTHDWTTRADLPAGLTPTSTALRNISGLFRSGRRPSHMTVSLLALPAIAALALGAALWGSHLTNQPGPHNVTPATAPPQHPVQLSQPATIALGDRPSTLASSPDGNRIYVAYLDGIAVIDPHTNRQNQTYRTASMVLKLFCSPNGRQLYALEQHQIEVLDSADGHPDKTIALLHDSFTSHSTLNKDGTRLLIANQAPTPPLSLTVVDTTTETIQSDWPIPAFATGSIETNTTGTRAYITGIGMPLYQMNLDTGQSTRVDALAGNGGLATSTDGHELYLQISGGLLATVNADTGSLVRTVAVPTTAGELLAAPQGQLIATDDPGQTLEVIDPATGAILGTSHVGQSIDYAAISPNGQQIFITNVDGMRELTMNHE